MWADGRLAFALGQEKRAEIVRRQYLQIMLGKHGPRHPDTIYAMSGVITTMNQRDTEEGEKLARKAVQLCLENTTEDADFCRTMSVLADTLYQSSEYIESCSISKNAMERFSGSLGLDHPDVIVVRIDFAWSLFHAEKLAESEEIFRGLVLQNAQYVNMDNKLNIWSGLAIVLLGQGKVDEAIPWYEKAFQARLASYGPYSETVRTCGILGYWYNWQGRHNDALQLYRNMISSIKETNRLENDEQDPDELIAEIEQWIQEVQEVIED